MQSRLPFSPESKRIMERQGRVRRGGVTEDDENVEEFLECQGESLAMPRPLDPAGRGQRKQFHAAGSTSAILSRRSVTTPSTAPPRTSLYKKREVQKTAPRKFQDKDEKFYSTLPPPVPPKLDVVDEDDELNETTTVNAYEYPRDTPMYSPTERRGYRPDDRSPSYPRDQYPPRGDTRIYSPARPRYGMNEESPPRDSRFVQRDYTSADVYKPPFPYAQPDPFFDTSYVTKLDPSNFLRFIKYHDITLVMFYNPSQQESAGARFVVKEAARNTNRPNHAYAGVDCTVQRELCNEENITKYPTFRLYSRGALVNTFNEDRPFMAGEMKKFVEEAPVIQELPRPRNKCKD